MNVAAHPVIYQKAPEFSTSDYFNRLHFVAFGLKTSRGALKSGPQRPLCASGTPESVKFQEHAMYSEAEKL